MKIKVFIVLIFLSTSLSAQVFNNLIRNPGFEHGSPDPTQYAYPFDNLDHWDAKFHIPLFGYQICTKPWHSPNWHKTPSFSAAVPAFEGSGLMSMMAHELAQQNFAINNKLEKDKVYMCRLKFQLAANMPGGATTSFDETVLKFYLAQNKIEYKRERCANKEHEYCKEIYKTIVNTQIKEYTLIEDLTIYPVQGGWFEASYTFKSPGSNYNHFGIELVKTTAQGCGDAFIFIDKVELFEYCQCPCAPQLDDVVIYAANAMTPNTMPWKAAIQNAIGYDLRIVSDFGTAWEAIVFEQCEFNSNGLDDFSYQGSPLIWEIFWNGTDEHDDVVPEDVYAYYLDVYNCQDHPIAKTGIITVLAPTTFPVNPWPDPPYLCGTPSFDYQGCCIERRVIKEPFIYPYAEYKVTDYLIAGGQYQIPSGADITFSAGNKILLEPGFVAATGSKFTAKIESCTIIPNSFKTGPVVQDNQDDDVKEPESKSAPELANNTNLNIHPNPTTGEFTIQLTGDLGQERSEVYIYDVFGRLIEQLAMTNEQLTVDISQYPQGIYLVKVLQGEEAFIERIIRQ